ncbi:MgtC/SapB family protein [Piscinibacter koreensis]|uniref:Protein MgtC n=1 Tax=Piscinibacter koreensis TaxID=2742824 RepID=A0A7Y6NNZ2_9BURK|nr:MgtC/SapB family protein [Schlegelella koreensis]NUZ06691.1 MgtC/SapB family protein [Schlegelella koreensis]
MITPLEVVVRLGVAALLGALVGLERERHEWAAGLRTHMLVCVGSALVMLVSMFGFSDVQGAPHVSFDPSRVAAQVVSGIGFLGAGTILFLRQEVIRGLTTAASLWTIAAVGLAVGSGLYVAAAATTTIALVILGLVRPLERRLFRRGELRRLALQVEPGAASLARIEEVLEAAGIGIARIEIQRDQDGGRDSVSLSLSSSIARSELLALADRLRALPGVRAIDL